MSTGPPAFVTNSAGVPMSSRAALGAATKSLEAVKSPKKYWPPSWPKLAVANAPPVTELPRPPAPECVYSNTGSITGPGVAFAWQPAGSVPSQCGQA